MTTPEPVSQKDLHDLARWLAWVWLGIGSVIAFGVLLASGSPWGLSALVPWALCQAAERTIAWRIRWGRS